MSAGAPGGLVGAVALVLEPGVFVATCMLTAPRPRPGGARALASLLRANIAGDLIAWPLVTFKACPEWIGALLAVAGSCCGLSYVAQLLRDAERPLEARQARALAGRSPAKRGLALHPPDSRKKSLDRLS